MGYGQLSRDMANFECQSVVNHFQAVATDKLPWTTALTENRGKEDRLIEIAISSAGTQYIGTMRKDQKLLDFSSSAYNRTCTSLMARFRDPLWWTQAPSLIIVTNALTIVSVGMIVVILVF